MRREMTERLSGILLFSFLLMMLSREFVVLTAANDPLGNKRRARVLANRSVKLAWLVTRSRRRIDRVKNVRIFEVPARDYFAALQTTKKFCLVATRLVITDFGAAGGPAGFLPTPVCQRDDPTSCCVTAALITNYYTVPEVAPVHQSLMDEVDACAADGRTIVFTGHGFGGVVADTIGLAFREYDPWIFTFGKEPTWFDLNVTEGTACPLVKTDRVVRFIRTETGPDRLLYDSAPYVGPGLPDVLNMAASGEIVRFNSAVAASLVAAMLPLFLQSGGELPPPGHASPYYLIPPTTFGNPRKVGLVYYASERDGYRPSFIESSTEGVIFANGTNTNINVTTRNFVVRHGLRLYRDKIAAMTRKGITTLGFRDGSQCNADVECESGICNDAQDLDLGPLPYKICRTTMAGQCMTNEQCQTRAEENFCVDGVCRDGLLGSPCLDSGQCVHTCVYGSCGTGLPGEQCETALDCTSGICEQRQPDDYAKCWD